MLAHLLLALAAITAITAFECGIANPDPVGSARVVNGQSQTYFKYPWYATIHYYSTINRVVCGGALISPQFVMSAAHCFVNNSGVRDRYRFYVTLGIFRRCEDTPSSTTYETPEVYIHPNFVDGGKFHDIALLKLDRASELMPVCLPPQDAPIQHVDNAHVAGFGQLAFSNPFQPCEINEAVVEIYTSKECRKKSFYDWRIKAEMKKNNIFCAGKMSGEKDACVRDSGSPILVEHCNRQFAMGVVSFGMDCALRGFPGIYTNVASYIDWINDTMKGELEIYQPPESKKN